MPGGLEGVASILPFGHLLEAHPGQDVLVVQD
jgi:hypothetical protein